MALNIEDMAVFCKRKGFVYQNSEIYGGNSGFWDFGHLGIEVVNNIRHALWKRFVLSREDVVGMDGAIISHPAVWKASGHVDCFNDVMLECSRCKSKVRGDQLIEDKLKISTEGMSIEDINAVVEKHKLTCEKCKGKLNEGKKFGLMFETVIGPVVDKETVAYLRPETAQLIFANYKLVADNARLKLPFGIAQYGKAFRNEISPRDFLFRSREFTQLEIEFFTHPDKIDDCALIHGVLNLKINMLTAEHQKRKKEHEAMTVKSMLDKKMCNAWQAYWLAQYYEFFLEHGIKEEHLRLREHLKDELAHYANACFDIEYKFPFGWKEIHGNADRKSFDIEQHMKGSGKDLSLYDEATKQKIMPYVASEPSQGIERAFLAFMFDAYTFDKQRENVVLMIDPRLAPVKAAVFPLVNKEGLPEKAREVFNMLKEEFHCVYDSSGSVGRRYARNDESGTPYCITVDGDTMSEDTVTVRERDSAKQIRVSINELRAVIRKLIYREAVFLKLGKNVK